MSNKVIDIDIKNWTYHIYDDIINTKNFDLNNIKIDENLCEDIFIYYIEYMTIKDSKHVKINIINSRYLIFNEMNGYLEKLNGSKYLTLVPRNESNEKNKKYEKLQSKIKYLIRSIIKKSIDFGKKIYENQIQFVLLINCKYDRNSYHDNSC